jgi:type IV secretion system protein VirB10
MSDNNMLTNESDKAASFISQVTPNPARKKFKDQALFITLVVICAIVMLASFLPGKTQKRVENQTERDASPDNTLSQNLKKLAEMRAKTDVLKEKLAALPVKDGHHPPKLRTAKAAKLSPEILTRMNAPTTFNIGATGPSSEGGSAASNANHTLNSNNPDAAFINQQDDIVSVSAKRLAHPELTVPAGELIPAILETAINSELPGMVRAITTQDVYSLSGGNLLIPKGATLVGQFNANVVAGQSRMLVVWNRVQMSNGVMVTLNSPGTDTLGRAGQGADYIDRHFIERFGSSALLSILGAYSANSGVNGQTEYNSESQYRTAISGSFQQASRQALEQGMMIKPTLQINQGTRINVFVAHDLDFNGVGAVKPIAASTKSWGGLWKK